MMEYPKGAIKSIEEFQALFLNSSGYVWEASRKFHIVNHKKTSGTIIVKKRPGEAEDDHYIGWEEITSYGTIYPSCMDSHLIDQSYNDWFLFTSRADAEAHTNRK